MSQYDAHEPTTDSLDEPTTAGDLSWIHTLPGEDIPSSDIIYDPANPDAWLQSTVTATVDL